MRAFFIFIGLLFITLGHAQQEEHRIVYDDSLIEKRSITEKDLETYKSDDDFNYTEKETKEGLWSKIIRWFKKILTKFWEAIFGIGTASGFLFFVLKVLPYILLGVLFYLLIRFFLKVNSNAVITTSKEIGSIALNEEEEIINNEDIPALIKDAVTKKDYRLAIRYYYLLALKQLIDGNIITWQAQKTNEDYLNDISQSRVQTDFQHITRIYDYVWYGEFDIDALKFEKLRIPFEQLNQSIATS